MKLKHTIFALILILTVVNLRGQTTQGQRLLFPFLPSQVQSNIIITADPAHTQSCPPEYTNIISNTNLFSLREQKLLELIPSKYINITTNSGPTGTIFSGCATRQWTLHGRVIKTFQVSCFTYTNAEAREELAFLPGIGVVAKFRTQSGDGYDVQLLHGTLIAFQEYNKGVLDGLCVDFASSANHCVRWVRFVKGRVLGKCFYWDLAGKIITEAEFKRPFDLLKYETIKLDLAWEDVQADATNSTSR